MFRGIAWLLLSGMCLRAAAPQLDCLNPVAVQRGTTNIVTAVGKFDPWPPKIWIGANGVSFVAETNKGKFQIQVAADAKAGPCFLRAYNEQGVSAPKFLLITEGAEGGEKEPNNGFDAAQKIEKFPATINSRFDKTDDVDTYRLELAAGQTVSVAVEAYVLASPVDAVLRLLDARGVEFAFNHDDGRTLDPEIVYTAPRDGTYFVQAFGFNYPADSNIRFVGNDKCVYRLHVSSGRCRDLNVSVKEVEPNNAATNATLVEIPSALSGCINSSEDEDVFKFAAKKGEHFVLKVESAAFGYPLDARLAVRNEKEEEVAKADDGSNPDPVLEWSPGNDGTFFAVVRNLLNRGGPDHAYRFSVERAQPSLKATVAEHAFTIEPGKTNKIKITLKRLHGFDEKLSFAAEGLPEGVTFAADESAVSLVVATDAKPFSGPIRIVAKDSRQSHAVVRELTTLGEDNGVPNGYSRLLINAIDQLWLTVTTLTKK